MKNNRINWVYICITLIGITAFILMMWVTPYGSGVSPDSTTYIGGAKSLLSGQGFSKDGSPITHFPPLYPLFLAVTGLFENNLIQAARLLNAIIFSINAGMVALVIYWTTKRNFVATICAVFFFLASAPFLEVHSWAWSEPLFMTLSLACIILLSIYIIRPTIPLLVASSLLLGFALLTRYIGIGFLLAALVIVFIGGSGQNIGRRFRHVLTWSILASAPLGILFTRNMLTGGIATDRKLIFHPVALDEYGQNFIFLLFHFFAPIPLPIPISVKLSIFGLLAIILIILLIFSFKRRQGAINWRRMDIVLPAACLLFFFFYLLFLYISLSFFDAGTPVDWRILSPILVILIVAIFSGMWAISQTLKAPIVWWGFLLFIVLSISIKTPNAIHLASVIQKNGLGYTARQWQESESIAFVRSLPDNVNIYSNGTDVLGFLTGKQVLSIPPKANSGTMMAYPHYDEKIKSMCKDIIENRAFLVYFNQISWRWYLPSQTEIEATCHLPVQQYFGDGTVYGEK